MSAAAALLCLAGGAHAHANVEQGLAVAVDGAGQVNGTGIACRDGSGDCVELYADSTSVTLTAVSDAGATFTGWGGDCTASGTNATCTLTMSSARAVTATFTAGGGAGNPTPTVSSSGSATLTVRPSGNGKITGGRAIACGAASTVCSENYTPGTTVTLTAVPNTGAAFLGWGGDCVAAGTNTTCTLTMSVSKNATASFSGATGTTFSTPGPRAGSTFAVHSNGTPLVARTSVGWAVTLRFFTSRSAGALLRLSQTGGAVHVFRFSPKAGNVLVGPFNVPRSGKYRFQITLSDGHGGMAGLTWNLCLGACARSRSAS